jgi:hypothetical protein
VVGVVVGGEDGGQLKLLAREIFEHRTGLARIDDRGVRGGSQRSYVVVLECTDRNNLRGNSSLHEPFLHPKRGAEV